MSAAVPAAIALLVLAATASAATIEVKNQRDAGKGSLRKAIANADPGDTIRVPRGDYVLKSRLTIADAVRIVGAGAGKTVIDGDRKDRVIDVTPAAAPVTLSRLTVTGGKEEVGAGINNEGQLTLSRVVVTRNRGDGEIRSLGAGISNQGALRLVRSRVTRNTVDPSGDVVGIGIASGPTNGQSDPVTIIRSSITNNTATGGGFGGGIAFTATQLTTPTDLTIRQSTIAGNRITGGSNQALGGAIYFGPVDYAGVQIGLNIQNSTISGNRVAPAVGGPGRGGGIAFTPIGDEATSNFPLSMTNTTVVGNRAGGTESSGEGGGIYTAPILNSGSTAAMTFTNVTIARNVSSDIGGGIQATYFGPAATAPLFTNSIVALNEADTGVDCGGQPVDSGGHNLERHTSCGFTGTGDQQNKDPKLEPLRRNGGPTKTAALRKGSPAINKGDDTACPGRDQRGVRRPQGTHCDIGAFELER